MIYTSYFANFRNFPAGYQPVSVALWAPRGFSGKTCSQLFPTAEIIRGYKNGTIDKEGYTEVYKTILAKYDPAAVAKALDNCILLCYEKKGDFCHRHLIADWLNEHGYKCEEL